MKKIPKKVVRKFGNFKPTVKIAAIKGFIRVPNPNYGTT